MTLILILAISYQIFGTGYTLKKCSWRAAKADASAWNLFLYRNRSLCCERPIVRVELIVI